MNGLVSVHSGSLGQIFNVHLTAIFPLKKPSNFWIKMICEHQIWKESNHHLITESAALAFPSVLCLLWAKLTYDGVGLRSKCAHTGGAWGHLELGEAPLGAEVLGKEAGWGQTAEGAVRQIEAEGWHSPSLRANIYPELPVRQQETRLTRYLQKKPSHETKRSVKM